MVVISRVGPSYAAVFIVSPMLVYLRCKYSKLTM